MEYAAGGDMFEYVVRKGGLRENEARWFFQQLLVAVDYIHRMGVANRDIKLENTLLDGSPRPLIKICDFGYSKHEKYQSAPGSRVGTPAYLAPEVIMTTKGKTYDGKVRQEREGAEGGGGGGGRGWVDRGCGGAEGWGRRGGSPVSTRARSVGGEERRRVQAQGGCTGWRGLWRLLPEKRVKDQTKHLTSPHPPPAPCAPAAPAADCGHLVVRGDAVCDAGGRVPV